MAQLRKMLGDVQDQEVVALMRLIETQSKVTLAAWVCGYVEKNYLPILERQNSQDTRLALAVEAAQKYLQGNISQKEAKAAIAEARKSARELSGNPIAQAAARAIATGCAVISKVTNALGFAFYGAAAYAYERAGLEAGADVYDKLASEEWKRIFDSLQAAAVADESNPVQVDWNC